ncbi:MAG: FKBP-type peptidyl-prolyl cis-trans isomerase [Undibacterium sp.]|nr:FKBP-type peptidyl-prolyl cis-trans isomerase [Opitutaceae bacterium]
MNPRMMLGCLSLAVVFVLPGCGPSKPEAPVTAKRDDATIMREWLYGPRSSLPGVVWQPSGLGIRVITPGTGGAPKTTDRVRVHYVCSLKDGKVIDDSHTRDKPADLVMKSLIAGWAEGMAALKSGGRAEFFIPPSLGYGTMGGGGVPAGAGLIFDVELIGVNPEPAAQP